MQEYQVFADRDALVAAAVERIVEALTQAINERGRALMLVSGGSSPEPVYRALAQRDLSWSSVSVALVDERWVDPGHSASNEGFIRRHLLTGPAAEAEFIGMKTSAETPQAGLAECESRYKALPEGADVCLLGMGSDGHTASLFPYAEGLDQALAGAQRCAAITAKQSDVTGNYTARMTLTAHYILSARRRLLLLTGEEKRSVLREALAGEDNQAMPVRAILNAAQTTDVFWAA